ncbi:hypothetical protein LOD99_2638 [Oopsacas minuta]|uniref:Uncharacterized protein n=1 Tax=Oopsacas minuta TaxID=111878 RepID=A0AAV7K238_9METZ|nr:hypothetical protein LOD99_2638 [Oopsacas minuta]
MKFTLLAIVLALCILLWIGSIEGRGSRGGSGRGSSGRGSSGRGNSGRGSSSGIGRPNRFLDGDDVFIGNFTEPDAGVTAGIILGVFLPVFLISIAIPLFFYCRTHWTSIKYKTIRTFENIFCCCCIRIEHFRAKQKNQKVSVSKEKEVGEEAPPSYAKCNIHTV